MSARPAAVPCRACGRQIAVRPSGILPSCCSRQCYYRAVIVPRRPRAGSAPRTCRGCGAVFTPVAEISDAPSPTLSGLRFCAGCRARTCPTCRARGPHRAGCPVAAGRARRPRPYRGVVSEAEVLDVYRRAWGNAVRVAAMIAGPAFAEDAVQAAAIYLWRRRDTLKGCSRGFFVRVVQQRAHQARLSAWRRHGQALGPEALAAVQRQRQRRSLAGG